MTTGMDLNRFSVSDLVNFLLAAMFRNKGYMVSTLRTIKAAALEFHVNAAQFACNPHLILLFNSLATQMLPIKLTPTFRAVRAILSTTTNPLAQLQRKMSFLLAMTCFLRPSDVQRIDRASMICQDTESLDFRVVAPKETRGHRRIIKPFYVCAHADPLLCPVLALSAFLRHPTLFSRHDPERERLLVNTTLPGHELQATIISTWHRRFLRLCTPEHLSVRSLASSLALRNGVPYDQVVTHGNWVWSITFEQHYRRDQLATHDFSAVVLPYNGDPISIDQVLEDS
ncbi:hypothetical protein [Parasitella parasitica]|uniref:Tyr recombinase domain-containing protein n=1 Tax=Parasitella parasitica TaxID=35722 RepID=A0A0B7N4K9_9FUNG|nr:hypothetical protein [Parasitella parasitica]